MVDRVLEAVQAATVAGELACADAHAVAAELGISGLEIGRVVNRDTEIRFNRCQLGLFGYGPKAEGLHIIALPAAHVPDDLREALEARVVNGRIPCLAVWEVAEEFKYPRLGVANVLEALGLRVKPCQLGCF
jgi:hypothetical protein